MELLKITFFTIGSFLGIENNFIASEKVIVTINPIEQTIHITQYNLFSLTHTNSDTEKLKIEVKTLQKKPTSWREELAEYPIKTLKFDIVSGNLNTHVSLQYNAPKGLKDYAISYDTEKNQYAFINIPRWNLQTNDGKIEGNYWFFDADKPFTFSLKPFINMPEEFKAYKKNLLPLWEELKSE